MDAIRSSAALGFYKLCRRILWRERVWGEWWLESGWSIRVARVWNGGRCLLLPFLVSYKLGRRYCWDERAWGRWWLEHERCARIAGFWDKGYCFPASGVQPQHAITEETWGHLFRSNFATDRIEEERIKGWMRLVLPYYTMLTYDALLTLVDQVRYCEVNRIPGVYVETGCNRGGSTAMMAKACLHYGGKPRPIHAFDSFEGLPQPDKAKDTDTWIEKEWKIPLDQHGGKMVSTGSMVADEDDVKNAFRLVGFPESHLFIHKGWFCDTAPPFAAKGEPIAILRLDGDLYSSTWDALVHLYPRVVEGGVVIIDDYAVAGARQAVEDYLATLPKPVYLSKPDGSIAHFIKPSA